MNENIIKIYRYNTFEYGTHITAQNHIIDNAFNIKHRSKDSFAPHKRSNKKKINKIKGVQGVLHMW